MVYKLSAANTATVLLIITSCNSSHDSWAQLRLLRSWADSSSW